MHDIMYHGFVPLAMPSSERGDGLFGTTPRSTDPIAERPPNLQATVSCLVPDGERRASLEAAAPGEVDVTVAATPASFVDGLSGNVAVAVLSTGVDDEALVGLVRETLRVSEHAQIVLVESDGDHTDEAVPRDGTVHTPFGEAFAPYLKRMYVRAYYAASLQRLFSLNIAVINQRSVVREDGEEARAELERLEESVELVEEYLELFRQYLQPEDWYELTDREETFRPLFRRGVSRFDPRIWGLPRRCPDCDLAWTVHHGGRLGEGYERIGANTWRCTRCSSVIANPDPETKRVL